MRYYAVAIIVRLVVSVSKFKAHRRKLRRHLEYQYSITANYLKRLEAELHFLWVNPDSALSVAGRYGLPIH